MIIGSVLPTREPVVSLGLHLDDGSTLELQAVVDTGFTESLALPTHLIERLFLQKRGGSIYTLADGSSMLLRNFEVGIEWFGSIRRVAVVEIDGVPLVGMALLRGSRLTIDIVKGGRVVIEPLLATN